MKSRPANINTKVEQLMLNKKFAQLTESERLILEDKFSPETYDANRKVLLAATEMFARDLPLPSPKVKANLLKAVAAQKEKSNHANWWKTLLNYPIPAWQPALGVSLVLLYFFIPWTSPENLTSQNELASQETDISQPETPVILAASIPVATVPVRNKNKNIGPVTAGLEQKNIILDTLQEVAQTIERTLRPVTERLSIPTMELSNTTLATNDTAGVRPQTMEEYWIDPVNIMAVQDQNMHLVSF